MAHSKSMKSLAVSTERLWPSASRDIGFSLSSSSRPRAGNMLPTLWGGGGGGGGGGCEGRRVGRQAEAHLWPTSFNIVCSQFGVAAATHVWKDRE